MSNNLSQYAIYLRKSRADLEAEQRGEGETLARHRRALTELADRRGYNVTAVYEEIVSGDSISSRPQMQALLAAVESGAYAGVIVNDIDRLSRGDSIDQGVVKQAFSATGTLIITPFKTYDPTNEADEDFVDFGLFMAHYGYRKIKQRMQTGRARSAAEGNYLGSRPVYGYRRIKRPDRSGWTLEPVPEKADIVRSIFAWYAGGESADVIARRLHSMGILTDMGNSFTAHRVRQTLCNPAYIGQVSWAKKVKRVQIVDGVKTTTRVVNGDAPIIVDNAHPAIIDKDTWDAVRAIFAEHPPLPKNTLAPLSNPLSGLVKCGICGYGMTRRPGSQGRPDMIACRTIGCPTTAIYIPIVEQIILDALQDWCAQYSVKSDRAASQAAPVPDATASILRQIDSLEKQLDRMYDLVEQGVYSPAVFVQRSTEVKERIAIAQKQLESARSTPTREEIIRERLPEINRVLEAYPLTNDAQLKNKLLRSIISRIIYHKTVACNRDQNPADYLTLDIYPKATK